MVGYMRPTVQGVASRASTAINVGNVQHSSIRSKSVSSGNSGWRKQAFMIIAMFAAGYLLGYVGLEIVSRVIRYQLILRRDHLLFMLKHVHTALQVFNTGSSMRSQMQAAANMSRPREVTEKLASSRKWAGAWPILEC